MLKKALALITISLFATTGCDKIGLTSGPVEYTAIYLVEDFYGPGEDPLGLTGATVTYSVEVDTSGMSPLKDLSGEQLPPQMSVKRVTHWKVTPETGKATITIEGSKDADGVYDATFDPEGGMLVFIDDLAGRSGKRDSAKTPRGYTTINGHKISASFNLILPDDTFTSTGPIYPKPILVPDDTKPSCSLMYMEPPKRSSDCEGLAATVTRGG